jgi:hypothetical protein
MNSRKIVSAFEWVRPAGIVFIIVPAIIFGKKPVQRFHILGPFMIMFMTSAS